MPRVVFNRRRWEPYALAAVVVALVATFVGGPLWLDHKLRREVDRFATPPAMRLVDRVTTGDFWCVITCAGKVTKLTFTSSAQAAPVTLCRVLRDHLAASGYRLGTPPIGTPAPDDVACFYWARAPRIRKHATVTALVKPSGDAVVVFSANNG